jgi:hypothetical protein
LKKNITIAALAMTLVSTTAYYQRKLYVYSLEFAETYCTAELFQLGAEIDLEKIEHCEFVKDDIWITLYAGRVDSDRVRIMECHLNYSFWGPSLPQDCQFSITTLTQLPRAWLLEKSLQAIP